MCRICVLTATRAEYGLLRWLMEDIRADSALELQLAVTGAHLSPLFGETWREIEADGFQIDARLEILSKSSATPQDLTRSAGKCLELLADSFVQLSPDLLVVLGDRYELLPVCTAAVLLDIPVAHISGGDVTEGAIDDAIRHAVTKLSCLHVVSSEEAQRRVLQMGEEPERVFLCGGPGLDNLRRLPPLTRSELAASLGLNVDNDWALLTWHPETRISLAENMDALRNILDVLGEWGKKGSFEVIATYANADLGGKEINGHLEQAAAECPWLKVCPSLGQLRYVNMLRQVRFMLGNSSSAIFETPTLGLPAVNIGNRQKGRRLTPNIIQCGRSREAIADAVNKVQSQSFLKEMQVLSSPYGDGRFSEKALAAIKTGLGWGRKKLLAKRFVDLFPLP